MDARKPSLEEIDLAQEKEAHGSIHGVDANPAAAALAAVTETNKPKMFGRGMNKLWLICSIGYLVSTMNGFDSSLMGSINAMTEYQKTFGLSGAGSSTGIIFIIYNLGQIAAFPFCGLLADGLGRRKCIIIGCFTVIVGTAIQTPANSQGMFIGGRFILGFGAAIASAAGPAYIVELAHPSFRGFQAGMYNNLWWGGKDRRGTICVYPAGYTGSLFDEDRYIPDSLQVLFDNIRPLHPFISTISLLVSRARHAVRRWFSQIHYSDSHYSAIITQIGYTRQHQPLHPDTFFFFFNICSIYCLQEQGLTIIQLYHEREP